MSLWNTFLKPREGWMDDSESDKCLLCQNIFSLRVRRHHCRFCCRLVCGECSDHTLEIDGDGQHHRVCKQCFLLLGEQGLVGQGQYHHQLEQESIYSLRLNSIDIFWEMQLHSSSLKDNCDSNLIFCVISVGEKVIKSTEAMDVKSLMMNDPIKITANSHSPLESHVTIELRDKLRSLTGEEYSGKCRIPLVRLEEGEELSGWHLFYYKTHHTIGRVWISLRKEKSTFRPEPILTMYQFHVPCCLEFSRFPIKIQQTRGIPVVWMFPPDSPLHKMLFLSMFSAETQSTPNPRSFLPSNEKYIEGLENIWMKVSRGGLFSRGVLLLTTHRIIFIQYPSRSSEGLETLNLLPQGANSFVMTIPLCNICSVSLRRRWKDKFHTLGLLCKNQIGYLFVSSRDEDEFIPLRAFRRMKSEICARVESDLFATGVETDPFTIEAYPLPDLLGTTLDRVISDQAKLILKPFNLGDEYTRMGIDNFQQWRRTSANDKYQLCESYPSELVVPSVISDNYLTVSAKQRSSRRLPALTWIHPVTGAALCRSSQPLVGIVAATCPEDEGLLMAIRSSVLTLENESAPFSCTDLNVSLDDISIQEDNQWTEIVPTSPDDSGMPRQLKASVSFRQATRENRNNSAIPHALSINNIQLLLANQVGKKNTQSPKHLASSHSLESAVRNEKSDEDRDSSDDESEKHMSSSTFGLVSRDMRDINSLNDGPKRLRIIDARPMINAKGNALLGKGHEVLSRLGGDSCTTLDFANIPNIHVVRDSLGALKQIFSEVGGNPNWLQLIHDTKWLVYLSLILKGAIRIALHLESGEPVLIHCSDGWDRTAQLCALSQLILSPYYRTIRGFKCLISKDFNSFGHMFRQRSGAHDLKEYSPIFVQFIDCVWQIWRQYPWEFEFTDKLLLTLVYAVNSRFCEDFIYDNERQETHHKKVLKQVVRETCCSDCRKRREAFGSFQSQPPRGSETSSSDAPTWKTVGDVGTNSRLQHLGDDDEESEEECSMCGELFAQCGTSVWNHVAYNLDDYVNPLYCPTHLFSSADGGKSCGLFSEPILCGGPYQTSQFHSNPGDNVASDADLGIHSHKSAYRSHLPHPSESSAFERLYGDFIPPVPPLGLDGELTPEGISLPRQLFVTASSSQKRLSLSAVEEKTPRDLSSSELLAESSEHPNPHMTPDASSKFAQSLSSAPSQDIHLLMPNFEVQHLALWEDAYFSGIPSLKSFGSSSSAFTRGIMASRIDIIKNQNRLIEQNELLEKKIDELSRQVKHLKEENELIATELSTFTHRIDHQSSSTSQFPDEAPSFNSDDFTVDDGFVVFKNVEKSDETDSMSRIISTGHLLEDYIPSSQR